MHVKSIFSTKVMSVIISYFIGYCQTGLHYIIQCQPVRSDLRGWFFTKQLHYLQQMIVGSLKLWFNNLYNIYAITSLLKYNIISTACFVVESVYLLIYLYTFAMRPLWKINILARKYIGSYLRLALLMRDGLARFYRTIKMIQEWRIECNQKFDYVVNISV